MQEKAAGTFQEKAVKKREKGLFCGRRGVASKKWALVDRHLKEAEPLTRKKQALIFPQGGGLPIRKKSPGPEGETGLSGGRKGTCGKSRTFVTLKVWA